MASDCMASDLASHQIMWINHVTKEFMFWKLQVVAIFLASEETTFEVDTASTILSYVSKIFHLQHINHACI